MRFLQLLQQQAGISRRNARAFIEAGRVELNGVKTVTPFMEIKVEAVESLRLDEKRIIIKQPNIGVYKYYKPRGMLCSYKDPHHHYAMGKVLRRPELKGYQIAGRLDRDAEGLLLLTNDGDLLHRLAHPRYQVEKVYHVLIPKVLRFRQTHDAIRQMNDGILDRGETLTLVRGQVLRRSSDSTTLVMVLTEGKNHEIKRLCRHFGWYVKRLMRVEMAAVQLGRLHRGELKPLGHEDVALLRRSVKSLQAVGK